MTGGMTNPLGAHLDFSESVERSAAPDHSAHEDTAPDVVVSLKLGRYVRWG